MTAYQQLRLATSLSIAFAAATASLSAIADENFSSHVDDKGNISLPEDFRASMAHLGSWFVPEGDASGFHDVYTETETVESFRQTGQFPDGAVLIKELRASVSADYTTGKGVHYAGGGLKQWFVMIKDTKNRFPENSQWGSGWGWALFKSDDKMTNASSNYQTDCLGCHVPAQDKDWVYTEAYPTLIGK